MPRLTKSRYLIGRQCSRRLWLAGQGVAEATIEPEEVWEIREAEGAEVEAHAEALFPGAVRIVVAEDDDADLEDAPEFDACLARTREVLGASPPAPAILQAHLTAGPLVAVADVLERRDDGSFIIWEVKASTSQTPMHQYDLAFQVEVARRAGLSISGCGVILLDKTYARGPGEIDPGALLIPTDLSDPVFELAPEVSSEIEAMLAVLSQAEMPVARPGRRCKGSPRMKSARRRSDCGHLVRDGVCGSTLPATWVGDLPRLDSRREEILEARAVDDLLLLDPLDRCYTFTGEQQRVITAAKRGEPWVDAVALRVQLGELKYPVTYLDFEFDPGAAIPRWEGCQPYDSIPFQWSMQVQPAEGAPLETQTPFLHDERSDPRRLFIEALAAALPAEGSIVVHHRQAEETVLSRLAERLGGEWPERVTAWRSRIFDTKTFLSAGFYHPGQRGSYSLKRIAGPVLGEGFGDLEIQHGMLAVAEWRRMIHTDSPGERGEIREALLAYCERDTWLLHRLIEAMRAMAQPSG